MQVVSSKTVTPAVPSRLPTVSRRLEVEGDVEVVGGQVGGRGPAGQAGLELAPLPDAAAVDFDDLPQGDPEGEFEAVGLLQCPESP